jgi:peptidoglycan/LPS O-acetylase OafA/YrhL
VLDSLATGVIVMLLVRYRSDWLTSRRRQIRWLLVVGVTIWILFPAISSDLAVKCAFLDRSATSAVAGIGLLYVLISKDGRLSRWLSKPAARTLGNMAYSTYLLHPIVLCVAFWVIQKRDPILQTPTDFGPVAAAGLVTAILSYMSWRLFESRCIEIGHRFQY